jgi:hypothetical protein
VICSKCGANEDQFKDVEDLETCTFYIMCRKCGNIISDEGIFTQLEEYAREYIHVVTCIVCGKSFTSKSLLIKPYCHDNYLCRNEYKRMMNENIS